MDIHGGAGVMKDVGAEKLFRDASIWTHLAGDSVQRTGRRDLGQVRFQSVSYPGMASGRRSLGPPAVSCQLGRCPGQPGISFDERPRPWRVTGVGGVAASGDVRPRNALMVSSSRHGCRETADKVVQPLQGLRSGSICAPVSVERRTSAKKPTATVWMSLWCARSHRALLGDRVQSRFRFRVCRSSHHARPTARAARLAFEAARQTSREGDCRPQAGRASGHRVGVLGAVREVAEQFPDVTRTKNVDAVPWSSSGPATLRRDLRVECVR